MGANPDGVNLGLVSQSYLENWNGDTYIPESLWVWAKRTQLTAFSFPAS